MSQPTFTSLSALGTNTSYSSTTRNAVVIVDGDYMLSSAAPTGGPQCGITSFCKHLQLAINLKERALQQLHHNDPYKSTGLHVLERYCYFTDDVLRQCFPSSGKLTGGLWTRQGLITILKKEHFQCVILGQSGGPIASGHAEATPYQQHQGHRNTSHSYYYPTPIDAAICSKVTMIAVKQEQQILHYALSLSASGSGNDRSTASLPPIISEYIFFCKQGYYELLFDFLTSENPALALAVHQITNQSINNNANSSGVTHNPTFISSTSSVHALCFEGDTLDETFLPYIQKSMKLNDISSSSAFGSQMKIPKSLHGGAYRWRGTSDAILKTNKPTTEEMMKTLFETDESTGGSDIVKPILPPSIHAPNHLFQTPSSSDVRNNNEVTLKPKLPNSFPSANTPTKEITIPQDGTKSPGITTTVPFNCDVFFDSKYKHFYFVMDGISEWDHPLGPEYQVPLERQVHQWYKGVQRGDVHDDDGDNNNPNKALDSLRVEKVRGDSNRTLHANHHVRETVNTREVIAEQSGFNVKNVDLSLGTPPLEVNYNKNDNNQPQKQQQSQKETPIDVQEALTANLLHCPKLSSSETNNTPDTNTPNRIASPLDRNLDSVSTHDGMLPLTGSYTLKDSVPSIPPSNSKDIIAPNNQYQTSKVLDFDKIRASLPSGWDCREYCKDGVVRVVFIDHSNKATSWVGPPGWKVPL